jgi:hypothetical protein
MNTRHLIITACLGTVICFCIFCSGVADAQPSHNFHGEFRGENKQVQFQKNTRADFSRQIEAAYERGFKDGAAVGNKLDKAKHGGERKFNRNKNYKAKDNSKKNFHNDFKRGSDAQLHAFHKRDSEHVKHYPKHDFHKDGKEHFVQRGFHREGFAKAPLKYSNREFGRVTKSEFRKGDVRKGEFKLPPFGKRRGEVARGHEIKKDFAPPALPRHERNKKGTIKKENRQRPIQSHQPIGDRS